MEFHEPSLNIHSGPHLLGRSEQYPYPTSIHRIEEQFLGCVGLGIMDERDFAGGDARSEELRTDIVVNVESFRIGRRKIAKDELSRALALGRLPNLDNAGNGKID